MSTLPKRVYGYLAEFENDSALLDAAGKVRDAGFRRWDCYAPHPVRGLGEAMGLRRSALPRFALAGGVLGALAAFLLAYLTQVEIFPTVVQGKPANIFTIPAFVPVIFEATILFAAIAIILGFLLFVGLPRLNHPVFCSLQIDRATDDAFFIAIEARDPKFSPEATKSFLEEIGGKNIELVVDEEE